MNYPLLREGEYFLEPTGYGPDRPVLRGWRREGAWLIQVHGWPSGTAVRIVDSKNGGCVRAPDERTATACTVTTE